MRSLALLLLAPLVGCAQVHFGPDGSGTSVGNPNKARVTLQLAEAYGFEHEVAVYPVEAIEFVGCDDDADSVWQLDRELDLLGVQLAPVPLVRSCEQVFVPAGNFVLSGTYEGTPYRVEFELPEVRMEGDWEIEPGTHYIIEFGGLEWLNFFRDPLVRGDDLDYGPDRTFHDLHRASFEGGAAVFEDTDGDGKLSAEEREAGKISGGEKRWKFGC